MSLGSWLKGKIVKEKVQELPPLPVLDEGKDYYMQQDVQGMQPMSSMPSSGFGPILNQQSIRDTNIDLIISKIDLINARLENLNQRLMNLERWLYGYEQNRRY